MYILEGKTCITFKDPAAEAIDQIRRIIDFRLALPHGTANRPVFDPATAGLTRLDNSLLVRGVTDSLGNPIENKITASSKIEHLFDGKYDRYARFWANENSYDLVVQLRAPAEVVMYSMVTSFQLQVPDRWKLYGAVSKGDAWTLLDERDAFPKPATNYTEKAFEIRKPGAYQYYRFVFQRCKFDLAQVHLYTR